MYFQQFFSISLSQACRNMMGNSQVKSIFQSICARKIYYKHEGFHPKDSKSSLKSTLSRHNISYTFLLPFSHQSKKLLLGWCSGMSKSEQHAHSFAPPIYIEVDLRVKSIQSHCSHIFVFSVNSNLMYENGIKLKYLFD